MPLTEQDLCAAEAARVAARTNDRAATAERNRIVRELLKQPGWTMQRVADVLGVKRAYINEIKRKGKGQQ